MDAVYLLDVNGVTSLDAFWVGPTYTRHDNDGGIAESAEVVPIPASGAVLKPNTDYQVVFVTTLERPGNWKIPSFDVHYRADGVAYTETVPSGLRLCAPANAECDGD